MKLGRQTFRAMLLVSTLMLSACTSPSNVQDPPPTETDTTIVTEVRGGVRGMVDQVDRAREVGADLDQRNASLESTLP
jgi:uncharacterized lipoprotein YajG